MHETQLVDSCMCAKVNKKGLRGISQLGLTRPVLVQDVAARTMRVCRETVGPNKVDVKHMQQNILTLPLCNTLLTELHTLAERQWASMRSM